MGFLINWKNFGEGGGCQRPIPWLQFAIERRAMTKCGSVNCASGHPSSDVSLTRCPPSPAFLDLGGRRKRSNIFGFLLPLREKVAPKATDEG